MRSQPNVLSIVLAGGEGKRLFPLTADRAKPAVPFGGSYRLIDFVLSNLVNAGYHKICVLTQYKSHSLDRHISQAWQLSGITGQYVTPVPAQQRLGKRWFTGSADAILQSLNLVYDEDPEHVIVFGAEDDDVLRVLVVDEVQGLKDRVRRTGEPALAQSLLSRHRGDVLAGDAGQLPRLRNVTVERMGLVLGQHADLVVTRVDQVRQHEVDEPVASSERNGGLCAVRSEREQTLALTAGENDGQDVRLTPHNHQPICVLRVVPGRKSPPVFGPGRGRVFRLRWMPCELR